MTHVEDHQADRNRDLSWIHPEYVDFGSRFRVESDLPEEFLADIRENGIITAITVVRKDVLSPEERATLGETNPAQPYMLIAGGRRTSAALALGHEKIPAQVFTHTLDELELRTLELHENIMRESFTFVEEVALKKRIHDLRVAKYGMKTSTAAGASGISLRDTADFLGVSQATMSRDVKLARAIEANPSLALEKTKDDALRKLDSTIKKAAIAEKAHRAEVRAQEAAKRLGVSEGAALKAALTKGYVVGDFFAGIKDVPDEYYDIIEIDPPYAVDLQDVKKNGDITTEDYNEVPSAEYLTFMRNVLTEAYRVAKPNAWVILWFGPEPWFEPMWEILNEVGFKAKRLPGIWAKNYGQTMQPSYNLANGYEMFFYGRKGDPGIRQQGRLNVFNFRTVASQNKAHPTERPVELLEEILRTFGSVTQRVLVPFAGSGNTLLAAANLLMPAQGFDLSTAYRDAFVVRVAEQPEGEPFHSYQ